MNDIFAPELSANLKPRAPKLAERLAERIEHEVVQSGLPIGTNLGFEPALIAKYGVSRSVLREAISILERGGLVEMLRGRYGGLTVASTPEDAAVNALQNYFSFVDYLGETRLEEILLVRRYLEPIALRQAARLVNADDAKELRALEAEVRSERGSQVRNARRILRSLFNTCKNPALIVLIRVLNQLSVIIGLYQNISREKLEIYSQEILKLRLPQIEALIAGELHELTDLQFQQIKRLHQLHEQHHIIKQNSAPATLDNMRKLVERLYEFTGIDRAVRQSDIVAQFMLYELWRNHWPTGHNLGYEPDLIAWIGTTKATFREALRVIERMGVVSMATGRGGGLLISTPDPNATLSSARLCLQSMGVTRQQTPDIEQALAIASISEIAASPERRTHAVQMLKNLLASFQADKFVYEYFDQQFRLCLADHCGNRIIVLFTQLLVSLFPAMPHKKNSEKNRNNEADFSCFKKIIAAIESNDPALARREMIWMQLALSARQN